MTFDCQYFIIKTVKNIGGDYILTSRVGRPTDNPKPHKITVRIDDINKKILDDYCKQENVSQMEAVRRGISKLKTDIK